MRSVNRATFITANMLLLSVPRAIVQPASRRTGMGGLTPGFAAMAAWCEMMVLESPSNAISVSSTYRGDTLGEAFTVPRPEFRGWVAPQEFYSDPPPGEGLAEAIRRYRLAVEQGALCERGGQHHGRLDLTVRQAPILPQQPFFLPE